MVKGIILAGSSGSYLVLVTIAGKPLMHEKIRIV